jgi:hypothetical protein
MTPAEVEAAIGLPPATTIPHARRCP